MTALRDVLAKLDALVYQVERGVLFVSLFMMTLLVGVDVVQRTFSRPEGRTATFVLALTGDRSPEWRALVADRVGPAVFAVLALALLVFAAWSARAIASERAGRPPPGFTGSLVAGLVVFLALAAFVKVVLVVFPSSVPGAQKFALGFMLWSGMVGASLATRARRHIVLDAVTKKLDPRAGRLYGLLGAVVTAAFAGFIALLGALQTATQVEDWLSGPGIGVFESLPIPYWTVSLAIPVSFGVIALRFLALGVRDFAWGPPVVAGPDAHGVDMAAIERAAAEQGHGG